MSAFREGGGGGERIREERRPGTRAGGVKGQRTLHGKKVAVGTLGLLALLAGTLSMSGVGKGLSRRIEAIDMHPYMASLGEEGRRQLKSDMAARSKLNTEDDKVYLKHEVKIGERADALLHRLPLDTDHVDTSLWNDRPAPCRGSHIRTSSYTSIGGNMREFPLARVECPYSSSGCCDEQQSPTPAERNGGSDHVLGADEDEETLQEQQEDTEDASMWKMRDLAAKQEAAGNGPPTLSPWLSSGVLHAQHDVASADEERKLNDENNMQSRLLGEMHKVRVMKRLLIQRQHARAAQSAFEKDDAKPHSLWKGVHIEITPLDLQEQTYPEEVREEERWQARNLTNIEWNRDLSDPEEEIRAAKKVLHADERFDSHRIAGVGGRREVKAKHTDRAQQAEIALLTPPSSSLFWEWDPRLHYHDLSPAGKPTRAIDSLRFESRKPSPRSRAKETRQQRLESHESQSKPDAPPYCVFCLSTDEYLSKANTPGARGSKDANPSGPLPFSSKDWRNGQNGYLPKKDGSPDISKGLKKPDFLNWFPNTNDLRVLDWLGAGDENEEAYDASKDSMSSVGALVPKPKDYDDFPKAKGYYTHYGGWHGGWKNAPGW